MTTSESRIRAAHAEEIVAGRVVKELDEIPVSYDHLSVEWLTKLLCAQSEGAEVIAFRAEDADDLQRGHVRVHLDYNERGRRARLPVSVFCKDSHNVELRLLNARMISGEVNFYRTLQSELGLETPNCLSANYDPRTFNSLLVFEDLEPLGTGFCTEQTSIHLDRAKDQLDYLARLHSRFHGKLESDPLVRDLRTLPDTYEEVGEVLGGFGKVADRGFRASGSVIPAGVFDRGPEVWPATERAMQLQRLRAVHLTHNDAHVRNWYLTPEGGMRLADWQVVGRGDWSFDLSVTISTSLTVDDRRAWERELIEFYLSRLALHGGPRVGFDEAWSRYRAQLFVALAGWTPIVRENADFDFQPLDATFEVIRRVATAMDDLDAFGALDEPANADVAA